MPEVLSSSWGWVVPTPCMVPGPGAMQGAQPPSQIPTRCGPSPAPTSVQHLLTQCGLDSMMGLCCVGDRAL